jgi:apolipoprotein N-acyltransferase
MKGEPNIRLQFLGLSVLSAVLLWLAWPTISITFLLYFGLVPLLYLERLIRDSDRFHKGRQVFLWAWLSFILWTLLTNHWIYNAHWSGLLAAMLVNGTLMAGVWWLYHKTSIFLGSFKGKVALIVYWLAFEYFHLDWDLSYPWMMLGNGMAPQIGSVQWYSYTGVMGGSLWILLLNLVFFSYHSKWLNMKGFQGRNNIHVNYIILLSLVYGLPQVFSHRIKQERLDEMPQLKVAVVQPNLDPYEEKFERTNLQQVAYFQDIVPDSVRANADLIVFPETALPDGCFEDNLEHDGGIRSLEYWIEENPDLEVIVGASTYQIYDYPEDFTQTSRPMRGSDKEYDAFNTAVYLREGAFPDIYHKSKLVAGVEMMPFQSVIEPLLGEVALDMGGIVGALGNQDERGVFRGDHGLGAAPVICYESVYGSYMAEYIRNGANLITIITNDGWWGDTEGHRQHFEYARIRAVETRRAVARSANTGISGFIDPNGKVLEALSWAKTGYLMMDVPLNNEWSFYTIYGDFIGRIATFMAFLFLAYILVAWRMSLSKIPASREVVN